MPAVEERFWAKVDASGDCWEWRAFTDRQGYGKFKPTPDGDVWAHRFVVELLVGPIPPGLQVDHLCRNRCCVNPDHLEVVAALENWRRGQSFAAINARKTHCPHGHPYDEANTKWDRLRGKVIGRSCRTCIRLRRRSRRAAERAERRASAAN